MENLRMKIGIENRGSGSGENASLSINFQSTISNFPVEAPGGFEPPHKGFADLSLTTWVRRQRMILRCS